MSDYRYLLLDVFTDTVFGGNQLAVFPDAGGLTTAQMQGMARELNLAESTFVTPGSGAGRFGVRIFTPAAELPFAGHPTVGTAVALAHLGRIPPHIAEIVLEEGVGPVRVAVAPGKATLFMEGSPEIRACDFSPEVAAEAVGLTQADLAGTPWQASYGLAFVFVPVVGRAAVARSALRGDRWDALLPTLWGRAVYIYAAGDRVGDQVALHARMFAPKLGVPEDPATGSAAAALVGSIDLGMGDGVAQLAITQGVEMGRPSLIEASVTRAGGVVTGISIGGGAVVVGDGRFTRLPA
jgi:trans-2,3-dihydro-3-hydroxyanthranilate isomerase